MSKYIATKEGVIIGLRGNPIAPVYKKNGYVVFSEMSEGKMRQTLVHRFVYEFFHGAIPDGMTVDHIDGVRHNNALSNLRLMSRGDNSRKGCCVLTEYEVAEIRLRRPNESGRSLAKEFSVSEQTICSIHKGRRY